MLSRRHYIRVWGQLGAGFALGVASALLSWLVQDRSAITAAASSRALRAASLGELLPQGRGWCTGQAVFRVRYRVRLFSAGNVNCTEGQGHPGQLLLKGCG